MKSFVVFAACFLVALQITLSTQARDGRKTRQIAFPDEGGEENVEGDANLENRFNPNWMNFGRRRGNQQGGNRPGSNQQGGNRPGNNNQQGGNNQLPNGGNSQESTNNQQQATSTTPATSTVAAPSLECLQRCPVTPEYNPVCGTNRQSYTNRSRLDCARQCGLNTLQFRRMGNC